VRLTGDSHVHSEWSWDTGGPRSDAAGLMEAMCHRALKIGLPALAFTEHLDITGWAIGREDLLDHLRSLVDANGVLTPEPLDAGGYLDSIERCRRKFPELHILTGVELGQPHIDEDGARRLVDLSALDRVNGSLHTLPVSEAPEAVRSEPITLYRRWPAERVVRDYLAEVHRVISGSDAFEIFTHIEYAVRYWPTQTAGPFNPRTFEDEFRQAMRAVAGSGRALELNIGGLIRPWIAQWWSEEGGCAITLASDAHTPEGLAGNFFEAMAMAEYFGFRPGRRPEDVWTRS
jgi:histidinol-phosphatase (PHP family)